MTGNLGPKSHSQPKKQVADEGDSAAQTSYCTNSLLQGDHRTAKRTQHSTGRAKPRSPDRMTNNKLRNEDGGPNISDGDTDIRTDALGVKSTGRHGDHGPSNLSFEPDS